MVFTSVIFGRLKNLTLLIKVLRLRLKSVQELEYGAVFAGFLAGNLLQKLEYSAIFAGFLGYEIRQKTEWEAGKIRNCPC